MANPYITDKTRRNLREVARLYNIPKRMNWRTKRYDLNISAAIAKAAEVAIDSAIAAAQTAQQEQGK